MGSIVITTIQAPTPSVLAMIEKGREAGMRVVIVGDRKTPAVQWPEGADFLGIADQSGLGYSLAALLPENHYSRKNLGYLYALSRRTPRIFDTDDDNAPLASWMKRERKTKAAACLGSGWVNAYRWFSNEHIWPRGLPLGHAHQGAPMPARGTVADVIAPIQQGLANGSPDVDAAWRLLLDRDITFDQGDSVLLPEGAWCPFNSQSTWWFPEAYPLMYLPSHVSFRMTDIWRSFVAQRCLWAAGYGVVFHGAEMFQDRNPHNLLLDFEQEIPGYLSNERIGQRLEKLRLAAGTAAVADNLYLCYEALSMEGIVPAQELPLVRAWIDDLERACE